MSRLSKLCHIIEDIESSTAHLTRGVEFAKKLATSGQPTLVEEMTMHLRWIGNHYTIVVDCDGTVGDLKNEIFKELSIQPQIQRMMNWNVLSHARPANDNTLLRDCDFLKDERLIKIGRTYVRLVKFHFQMEKKLPTLNFKQLGLKGPNTLKFLCNQMPQRSLSNPEDWPENSGFDPRARAPLIS